RLTADLSLDCIVSQESQSMPPSQIFVSTRTRREYQRRRGAPPIVPVPMLLLLILLVWGLAALVLGWGGV
ncbi:MAG TPA: hypothetical protein VG275_13365, partial [Solirubrobacteraceae bacterium]|nr:hypothetical protein [Solirubrobacteraceae bacterium]